MSRDHPNPVWAAEGEKEYRMVKLVEDNATRDKSSTIACSDMVQNKKKRQRKAKVIVSVSINYKVLCRSTVPLILFADVAFFRYICYPLMLQSLLQVVLEWVLGA